MIELMVLLLIDVFFTYGKYGFSSMALHHGSEMSAELHSRNLI